MNDPTSSAINAVVTTAHGAGAYTSATGFTTQTDINTHESNMQSYINVKHGDTQSLINNLDADVQTLNNLSVSQVQSIINVHESNIQSDLNAMNVKLIRIEGQNGLYLVGEYSYNSSDINTKIEFWQYSSQTDMNNHQTVNNINKWQGDVTLTGQLASIIKFGDHA